MGTRIAGLAERAISGADGAGLTLDEPDRADVVGTSSDCTPLLIIGW